MEFFKRIIPLIIALAYTSALFGQTQIVPEVSFINQLKKAGAYNTFSWKFNDGKTLKVDFQSFHIIGNKLSSHGTIKGASSSNVMFKINDGKVYGYVLDLKTNKGYKFESDNKGNVTIENVAADHYYHVLDFKVPQIPFKKRALKPFANVQSKEYPHVQPYVQGMDLHALESKPGSPNVIFMDWRAVFNGNTPKHLTPEEMYKVWAGTAAGYIAFDVNVTTSPAVYNSVPVTNSCVALFKDFDARSHAPGNSWGTTNSSTIYKSNKPEWYINTLVHEIGHQVGLDHDGAPHQEYFGGIGEYDWNSIMGNFWYANFIQYSKGEYNGANNFEDDFAVINGYIPYRNFEVSSVKTLSFAGDQQTVTLQDNIASIEQNIDEDTYTFNVNEAKILNLKIEPLEFRSMLDVDARIEDPNGNILAQSNVALARIAEFKDLLLDQMGTYKLIIKGGAEGTPQWGFSNYSSVGVYGISGSIRNLHSEEIQMVKLSPFEEVCNSYAPTVEIKNLGKQTINSVELEVTVGNDAPKALNINNLSIATLGTGNLKLDALNNTGNNIPLKVSVKKINGNTSSSSKDLIVNYTLGKGISMELNIDNDAYPYTKWFIENSNGIKIADTSNIIEEVNENGENKLRFCLESNCYKLKVSHDLESCSNVEQWSSGKSYQGGATVIHQAKDSKGFFYTYTNKWWATGSNVPGSGDPWEISGVCTGSNRGSFSLKEIGALSNLVDDLSSTSTNELSFDFCPSVVTNKKEVSKGNVSVYPNPFNKEFTVRLDSELISSIEIFNINGQKIFEKMNINSASDILNLNVIKGTYLLRVIGEHTTHTTMIVK